MSKNRNLGKRLLLLLYIVVLCVFLTGSGIALTLFLINTLRDPASYKLASEADADFESILMQTEQDVVRHMGEWTFSEPKLLGHFHHIGRWYDRDTWNFCIDCHGPVPHSNSPQIRAFLNMHTPYISCHVCHVQEKLGKEPTRFTWIRLDNGERTGKPMMQEGVWGEYGAKIIQLSGNKKKEEPLCLEEEKKFALKFKMNSNKITETQKVIANNFIHKRCMDEPLRCNRCHTPQKTFIPYKELGYSGERTAFLVEPEVVDLVQRYETFFMPTLFNLDKNGSNPVGREE